MYHAKAKQHLKSLNVCSEMLNLYYVSAFVCSLCKLIADYLRFLILLWSCEIRYEGPWPAGSYSSIKRSCTNLCLVRGHHTYSNRNAVLAWHFLRSANIPSCRNTSVNVLLIFQWSWLYLLSVLDKYVLL